MREAGEVVPPTNPPTDYYFTLPLTPIVSASSRAKYVLCNLVWLGLFCTVPFGTNDPKEVYLSICGVLPYRDIANIYWL